MHCRFFSVAWTAIFTLAILVMPQARAGAADSLLSGTQVGAFHLDYDLDGYTAGVSTLESNLGAIGGMTRLPNGDMVLGIGTRLTSDKRYYIYIFHFDLTMDPPYTIVKGPLIPRYASNDQVIYGGGLTYLGNNEIALRGSWTEKSGVEGVPDIPHPYLFRMNLDGAGDVTPIMEMPHDTSLRDMVYLPQANVQQPEGWGFTRGGDSWSYWITSWGNLTAPLVEVPAASLHMSPHGMMVMGNINDGDLIALGFHEFHRPEYGFQKEYYVCTRFDRTGKYKGMWLLGPAIVDSRVDYSMGPIGELSNGDIVCGTGWQSINEGEASSYHYYIIRPPEGAGAPIIQLDATSIRFAQTKVDGETTVTLKISNAGSSNLIVNQFEMTGTGGSRFSVKPPAPLDIAPGLGFPGPESSVDVAVSFQPNALGKTDAQLWVHSNDPAHETVKVFLSGYGVSPILSDDALTTISMEIMPDFAKVSGMHFTPDGSRLVTCIQTNLFDWTYKIRSFRVLRGPDCRMTGLDTTTCTEHFVIPRGGYNDVSLTVGTDGTLWAGLMGTSQLIQYKSDGARFEQTMPGGATITGIELSPNGNEILSAAASHIVSYPLTQNDDGFWVLGAARQLPYSFPTNVYQFIYCHRPDGKYDLYVNYGGIQHLTAPADFFTAGTCSGFPTQFWDAVSHSGDCIDPITNDLIYCAQPNQLNIPVLIRRRGGTHELFGTTLGRSRLCNILLYPHLDEMMTPGQRAVVDVNGDDMIDVADMIHLVNNGQ